jgi:hypothetical protein
MKRSIKCAAAAAALILCLVEPVQAHDWIVLNGGAHACEIPAPLASSPYKFENGAREAGMYIKTDVTRDHDGKPMMVGITVRLASGVETTVVYFSTLRLCRIGLSTLPSRSELE